MQGATDDAADKAVAEADEEPEGDEEEEPQTRAQEITVNLLAGLTTSFAAIVRRLSLTIDCPVALLLRACEPMTRTTVRRRWARPSAIPADAARSSASSRPAPSR